MPLTSGQSKMLLEGKQTINLTIFLRRILVGLRWWSVIDDHGKETWHFESLGESSNQNKVDNRVFWTG